MRFAVNHWWRIGRIFADTRIEDGRALEFNELLLINALLKELAGLSTQIEGSAMMDECHKQLADW